MSDKAYDCGYVTGPFLSKAEAVGSASNRVLATLPATFEIEVEE